MDYPLNNQPVTDRYDRMQYKYCGKSGLQLPLISLGLWHNFGSVDNFSVATDMIKYAFDHGITHFDLANNYGPVPGSAETNFGRILKENFQGYRDEMIISSKAGHDMWMGPYGGNSSRKNLMASIDQSLRRTGLEYFDIFYSHRYDGVTPVEETIQTLIDIVKQGKALYLGISKYPPQQARIAYEMMAKAGVPCLISQYRYSMFDRAVEAESLPLAAEYGSGFIAFSPLAQGLLTDKYLNGIPEGSRAARPSTFLQRSQVTPEKVEAARRAGLIRAYVPRENMQERFEDCGIDVRAIDTLAQALERVLLPAFRNGDRKAARAHCAPGRAGDEWRSVLQWVMNSGKIYT